MGRALLRRLAGTCLLLFSLALLAWGVWPTPTEHRSVSITAAELTGGTANPGSQISKEDYQLWLEWPRILRVGDAEEIRLSFEPASLENPLDTSAASAVQPPSLVLQARLELAGMQSLPQGEIRQALTPGRSLHFRWELRSSRSGQFRGVVWIHLVGVHLADGNEVTNLVSAQRFETEVTSLLGLSGRTSRVSGAVGAACGALLGFDWLVQPLERLLRRRKQHA